MPGANERLRPWLAGYSADHRTAGNVACHSLGVPLVALSVLGLLWPAHLAAPLAAGAVAWYLYLDPRIGLAALPFMAGLCALAALWGWRVHAALFVSGWALQFLGHYRFEKRPPAFFRDQRFLLIGPLWVVAKLLRLA
jgi:uncharacterized membrane protein YGL010W